MFKNSLKFLSRLLDYLLLLFLIIIFLLASYMFLDEKMVYDVAKPENFVEYKPKENPLSFEELKTKNDEVRAWLQIYGTSIDYPVVQAKDNVKYLNLDVFGNFSLAGSIFMDYRNDSSFKDFSTIIYGHHMAESAMFGDISKYSEKEYFDKYRYGNLYIDGNNYGLEVFAFIPTSINKPSISRPQKIDKNNNEKLLKEIKKNAAIYRDVDIKENDKILIFYTCSFKSQDDRDLLIVKVLQNTVDNKYQEKEKVKRTFNVESINNKNILVFLILVLIILIITYIILDRKQVNVGNRKAAIDE